MNVKRKTGNLYEVMVDSLEVVKILLVWEASTRKLFLKVDWEETF